MRKRHFYYLAALGLFGALIWYSAPARAGAERGLALWSGVLVPSLLPYFAAAGLLTRLGFADAVGRRLSRVGKKLLGVGAAGCAVFVLGLSGGYPLGAAAAAEAVKEKRLSPREGERLLGFCDNTGPAFAVGALGAGVFRSAGWGLFLWGVHVLAALLLGAMQRGSSPPEAPPAKPFRPMAPGEALSASVSAAVGALLSIGGYVVFFSAMLGIAEALGFPDAAASLLSARLGWDGGVCRAALVGTLELSSGVGAMAGMPADPLHLALGAYLLGWGGLCVHFQAAAVTAGTGMGLGRRLRGKLCHGLLSAMLARFLAGFLI